MKQIPLTQGQVALVNDVDYKYLNQWKWCYNQGYVVRNSRKSKTKRTIILMHRIIAERMSLNIKGKDIDHIDMNTLNNRRSNIRIATRSQNQSNRNKQQNNTSGYKGVGWKKQINKWQAYIAINRHQFHLGYFTSKIQAAKAYNEAAIKYFGPFAKLNEV